MDTLFKRIFFDNDNTLSHASYEAFEDQPYLTIPTMHGDIYTILRPVAKDLLQFSRDLVGFDNVYMLTTATGEYAKAFNEKAELGFEDHQIIAREDIEKYFVPGAYGGGYIIPNDEIANPNNVLIDNLPPRYNTDKMSLIGINSARYLEVDDYYGVSPNNKDQIFVKEVKEFLQLLNSQ